MAGLGVLPCTHVSEERSPAVNPTKILAGVLQVPPETAGSSWTWQCASWWCSPTATQVGIAPPWLQIPLVQDSKAPVGDGVLPWAQRRVALDPEAYLPPTLPDHVPHVTRAGLFMHGLPLPGGGGGVVLLVLQLALPSTPVHPCAVHCRWAPAGLGWALGAGQLSSEVLPVCAAPNRVPPQTPPVGAGGRAWPLQAVLAVLPPVAVHVTCVLPSHVPAAQVTEPVPVYPGAHTNVATSPFWKPAKTFGATDQCPCAIGPPGTDEPQPVAVDGGGGAAAAMHRAAGWPVKM